MTMLYRNKVVVITGGTSGIGRATVERFAAAGAAVAFAGRRRSVGLDLEAKLRSRGGDASFIETDVSSAESVADLFAEIERRYGRIDCAFNNAGIPGANFRKTADQDEMSFDRVMATNVRGLWLCMKHEIRQMCKLGCGTIVNTGSIYSLVGSEFGIAPYVASKHAVVGLTRAAAIEYASDGIRINAVCPGITHTEMTAPALESAPEEFSNNIKSNVPLGRLATPEEIAGAVLWLCSAESTFVTGQVICVDGGWLAR
jgi:NAD(P)-dependent dehydrogenase (short-subunit alcohol dehydrogenase family)